MKKKDQKKLIDSLAEELHRKRAALLGELAGAEQDLQTIAQEREAEMEESAQKERISTILDRLDGRQRRELQEIDDALQRIASGDYGKCAGCGEPIPVERLRAVPMTQFCMECASERERKKTSIAEEESREMRMPADSSVLKDRETEGA